MVPFLILMTALQAPADAGSADPVTYNGDAGELAVTVPRLEGPIRIDASLDDAAWSGAAVLSGFTQYEPTEGRPATEPTEVRVVYGADAIYFGIRAYDSQPAGIRATLGERDSGVFSDDFVRIQLDTYNDNRRAYLFYVNPYGVQADALWVEGSEGMRPGGPPIDFNPDFIWESDGRVTEDGWVAEIRIPYLTLRFRDAPSQTWGLNVTREVKRTGYKQAWAPITANVANQLELAGRLVDMQGITPRALRELNPVVTGKRTGELTDGGDFVRDDFEPSFGLNARYGLTPNLILDATFNPDFSQVEADAGQVAVNERFALFFPEKRPFFLEGTEIFGTPQRLVYTRAIVDPVGGAKLTGKLGEFNAGWLGAVDESPVTFDDASDEALFNLFRVRRDIGSGSTVGALYADRTILDGSAYNRVGAVDTRLVLGERYSLTAQLAGAWTADPPDEAAGPTAGETVRFGPLFHGELRRSGRELRWDLRLVDVHPDFRARSGFIRRVGDANASGSIQRTFFNEPGSLLESWGPEVRVEGFFDHDDFWSFRGPEEGEIQGQVNLDFRGSTGLNLILRDGYFAFDAADYAGYELAPTDPLSSFREPFLTPAPLEHLIGFGGFFRTQPSSWLSLNGRAFYREVPIYAEGSRGVELLASPSLTLRPMRGLSTELSITYSRIVRAGADDEFSEAQIPRLQAQYQFNRALFVRGILQYDLQDRDALRSASGDPLYVDGVESAPRSEGDVQYDLLLGYQPSPGTVVYAGWTRVREGPSTYRFGDLTPISEGLFLKVSYLFRL